MQTIEAQKTYHMTQIGLLRAKVEAAMHTGRNVDLERTLIAQHSLATIALDFGRETSMCSEADPAG